MKVRGVRKELVGTVIRDKMEKTVVVETEHHIAHPKYKKVYVRRTRFMAHDEKDTASLGDVVRMRESRPLSKAKRWRVIEVLRKAKVRPEEVTDKYSGRRRAREKESKGTGTVTA